MKVLQINATLNSGSTGRIAEEIGQKLLDSQHASTIAYGRTGRPSASTALRVGSRADILTHVLVTKLFDRHGFASRSATKALVADIEQSNIVHLHNLHGYYLHVGVLFRWLKATQKPVVWTLHDCWAFTGHCTFFDSVSCQKWISGCHHCPKTKLYPASWGVDSSPLNYRDKKDLFNGLANLTIVTPSAWLRNHVQQSFLSSYPVQVIHNGVDTAVFSPQPDEAIRVKLGIGSKKVVLGVASIWDKRKGLDDFVKLSQLLDSTWQVILIGVNSKQIKSLPAHVMGIPRTESVKELADFYSLADVFVNPTWQDNFPTTNIESLACGTPVITYNTGGSPEAIVNDTGFVVEKGDIAGLYQKIIEVSKKGKVHYQWLCRKRAEKYFNKDDRYMDYLKLYERLTSNV